MGDDITRGTMNNNLVRNALVETLTVNRDRIEVMSQYSGGWEGWLQCELSLCWGPGEVEREVALWNDRRACDLWFPETKFCVELKCFGLNRAFKKGNSPMHISDSDSTYSDWCKDILKDATKLEELPEDYNGLSVVVVPTWLPVDAFRSIKSQLVSSTYYWFEQNGFYIGLRRKGWL